MTPLILTPSLDYAVIEDRDGAPVLTVAPGVPNARALAHEICARLENCEIALRNAARAEAELAEARAMNARLVAERNELRVRLEAAESLNRLTARHEKDTR